MEAKVHLDGPVSYHDWNSASCHHGTHVMTKETTKRILARVGAKMPGSEDIAMPRSHTWIKESSMKLWFVQMRDAAIVSQYLSIHHSQYGSLSKAMMQGGD